VRATVITQSELEALAAAQSKQSETHTNFESKTLSLSETAPGSHLVTPVASSGTPGSAPLEVPVLKGAGGLNASLTSSSQPGHSTTDSAQPGVQQAPSSVVGSILAPSSSLPGMKLNQIALTGLVPMTNLPVHPVLGHQPTQSAIGSTVNLQTSESSMLAVSSTVGLAHLAPPGVDLIINQPATAPAGIQVPVSYSSS